MQTFRTTFDIPESKEKINYHTQSIFIGSCFTENIGNYMKTMRFQTISNPTGIIYNPFSINECIHFVLEKKQFNENSLGLNNEVWFSFHHHGRFSDPDKTKCLAKINHELKISSEFIFKTDLLFLTFGTAYVYRKKDTGQIVANCHKFPSETFSKSLLQPQEIVEVYERTLDRLKKINPKINVVFTVSPIRHWKDGASENQLSKSILFVSIHELLRKFSCCSYFPAYELMMDDLRDYRFYAEDMIHPNVAAIDYIRKKFTDTFIDKDSQKIMTEIQKLLQAKDHRPFNTSTAVHRQFKEANLKKVAELKKSYPFLDLEEFDRYFRG